MNSIFPNTDIHFSKFQLISLLLTALRYGRHPISFVFSYLVQNTFQFLFICSLIPKYLKVCHWFSKYIGILKILSLISDSTMINHILSDLSSFTVIEICIVSQNWPIISLWKEQVLSCCSIECSVNTNCVKLKLCQVNLELFKSPTTRSAFL